MGYKISELQILENFRLAFANFDSEPTIKSEMNDLGYDETKMLEGKTLFEKAVTLYNTNKQETAEEKEAYAKFAQAYEATNTLYRKHRKYAKVALMKKTELWSVLSISKPTSKAYLKWFDEVKMFYEQGKSHPEAQPLLEKYKVTTEAINKQLENLQNLADLRAKYEKEKGESQDATQQKNKAFEDISEWMREFYAVAKIALDDRPQLLQVIGKFMRS